MFKKNHLNPLTPFQKKLFTLIKKIPKGKVSTYKQVAKKLDSSPRAVGQALKKNPFAPLIPCHRVIKSDFSIGGYEGSLQNNQVQQKLNLLKKEKVLFQFKVLKDKSKVYYFNKKK